MTPLDVVSVTADPGTPVRVHPLVVRPRHHAQDRRPRHGRSPGAHTYTDHLPAPRRDQPLRGPRRALPERHRQRVGRTHRRGRRDGRRPRARHRRWPASPGPTGSQLPCPVAEQGETVARFGATDLAALRRAHGGGRLPARCDLADARSRSSSSGGPRRSASPPGRTRSSPRACCSAAAVGRVRAADPAWPRPALRRARPTDVVFGTDESAGTTAAPFRSDDPIVVEFVPPGRAAARVRSAR